MVRLHVYGCYQNQLFKGFKYKHIYALIHLFVYPPYKCIFDTLIHFQMKSVIIFSY